MLELGMTTEGECYTVNSEYTVAKIQYNHLSYTLLFGYINYYYTYKTHNKAFLNANEH
jgi:hypothetical protein